MPRNNDYDFTFLATVLFTTQSYCVYEKTVHSVYRQTACEEQNRTWFPKYSWMWIFAGQGKYIDITRAPVTILPCQSKVMSFPRGSRVALLTQGRRNVQNLASNGT